MLITEDYRQLNRAMFQKSPGFGTSGGKWASRVRGLAERLEAKSVLDYGCGRGTLAAELGNAPFDVMEYDPAYPGKEAKPAHADLVVCGDVLEHIEPECLHDVLHDIRCIAAKAVFLVVATTPAAKTLPDGRNAHLIVEPAKWWMPKIMERWAVREFKDFGSGFVCVGETRW